MGLSDTRPEIERIVLDAYRRMSPAEKLVRVFDLTSATRELSAARIRAEHPGLSAREIDVRVAALVYGRDLVLKATGIDPGPIEG
jgi:hypothetical protein